MTTIRAFEPEDAPAVAALFQSVARDPWPSTTRVAEYFRELFVDNPWRDPEIPSWAALEGDRMIGFAAVMPRPMMHGKKPIRVAVSCQFFVHPEYRRSLAAVQLLRALLRGPQDLTLADGATEGAAKMWTAMGGILSPLHRMSWVRPVRPMQSALWLTGARRAALRPLAMLARPIGALADACVMRLPPLRSKPSLHEEDLDTAKLLAGYEELGRNYTMRPQYDYASLDWLMGQVAAKKRHGPLQARLVRDSDGKVAGWFLYYLSPGLSRVVQLVARPGSTRAVLEHLFRHAADHGALALEGRIEPRFTGDMGNMHCFFQSSAELTLLHARDPAVLAPLMQGDAFFTRLEGEWWPRFHGEPARSPEREAGSWSLRAPPNTRITAASLKS